MTESSYGFAVLVEQDRTKLAELQGRYDAAVNQGFPDGSCSALWALVEHHMDKMAERGTLVPAPALATTMPLASEMTS